jgi:hypothetical protein
MQQKMMQQNPLASGAQPQQSPMGGPPQQPMPPQQRPPMGGPPQQRPPMGGPPQQPQTPWGQAMASPGMAMASAAANNFTRARFGQGPVDPVKAYQDTIAQQSAMKARDQLNDRQERAAQIAEEKWTREQNPMADFQSFIAQRPELAGATYEEQLAAFEDFSRVGLKGVTGTSVNRNFDRWMELNPNATDDQKRKAWNELARAGTVYDIGGGGKERVNPLDITGDTAPTELVSPEDATTREAELAGTKAGAVAEEDLNWKRIQESQDSLWALEQADTVAQQMHDTSSTILNQLETGEVDPGIINAFLLRTFGVGTGELAAMDADAVGVALDNLQITNLAPVTENELKMIARMWADIARQEEPNKGLLRRTMARTERLQKKIRQDAKNQGRRLKGRNEDEYNSTLEANDWVRGILAPPDDTGAVGGDDTGEWSVTPKPGG